VSPSRLPRSQGRPTASPIKQSISDSERLPIFYLPKAQAKTLIISYKKIMHNEDRLFSTAHLDQYLEAHKQAVIDSIKKLGQKDFLAATEQVATSLLQKYLLSVPVLSLDAMTISPEEAEIEINNRNSRWGYLDASHVVNGLRIQVKIPFIGSADLFQYRPSTWSVSGDPSGEVEAGQITLTYETAEKDQTKIKALWENDIKAINERLGWVRKDVEAYNGGLATDIKRQVENRKKEAGGNQSLIESLKR
jgi:hypothetical protein